MRLRVAYPVIALSVTAILITVAWSVAAQASPAGDTGGVQMQMHSDGVPQDLSGFAPASKAEIAITAETDKLTTPEQLAKAQLDAARKAGAVTMSGPILNMAASDACLAVLSGSSDIDSFFATAVPKYGQAAGVSESVAIHDIAADLSVAGYYCPQLWDEFQAWVPPRLEPLIV